MKPFADTPRVSVNKPETWQNGPLSHVLKTQLKTILILNMLCRNFKGFQLAIRLMYRTVLVHAPFSTELLFRMWILMFALLLCRYILRMMLHFWFVTNWYPRVVYLMNVSNALLWFSCDIWESPNLKKRHWKLFAWTISCCGFFLRILRWNQIDSHISANFTVWNKLDVTGRSKSWVSNVKSWYELNKSICLSGK